MGEYFKINTGKMILYPPLKPPNTHRDKDFLKYHKKTIFYNVAGIKSCILLKPWAPEQTR